MTLAQSVAPCLSGGGDFFGLGRRRLVLRVLAAVGAVLLTAWPAIAGGYPDAHCTLGADTSRMLVVASNPSGKAYRCMAECRLRVAGQRAFDRYRCTFALRAGTGEKTVCVHKAGGSGRFTKVDGSQSTCVPR